MSTNNHYAGFGPITARMLRDKSQRGEKIISFPIINYKHSFDNIENENYSEFDNLNYKKTRQSSIHSF